MQRVLVALSEAEARTDAEHELYVAWLNVVNRSSADVGPAALEVPDCPCGEPWVWLSDDDGGVHAYHEAHGASAHLLAGVHAEECDMGEDCTCGKSPLP